MTLLLVAATPFEILPISRWLEQRFSSTTPGIYTAQNLTVRVLGTGIGQMATAWHLGQELARNRPDLALNLGIAGALDRNFALTDVVQVVVLIIGGLVTTYLALSLLSTQYGFGKDIFKGLSIFRKTL